MGRTDIAKKTAQTELRLLLTYWRERLGATFKCGTTELTDLEALDPQLETALEEETTAVNVLAGKQTVTNGIIGQVSKIRVKLRREVDNEFGPNSPEAKSFPGGDTGSKEKKPMTD